MSVPLANELHERLAAESERADLPMVAVIRLALREYLKEREGKDE
jgi:predicted DNA-binding protein